MKNYIFLIVVFLSACTIEPYSKESRAYYTAEPPNIVSIKVIDESGKPIEKVKLTINNIEKGPIPEELIPVELKAGYAISDRNGVISLSYEARPRSIETHISYECVKVNNKEYCRNDEQPHASVVPEPLLLLSFEHAAFETNSIRLDFIDDCYDYGVTCVTTQFVEDGDKKSTRVYSEMKLKGVH